MIEVRGAHRDEMGAVHEILLDAFPTDDEAKLWDHLLSHDPALKPEYARLAFSDGNPVACTVLLPRRITTPRGFVDGAIVTLVGCKRAFRHRGFGGATVKSILQFMTQSKFALGFLYGIPTYYPQFGFVPVVPKIRVEASLPQVEEWLVQARSGAGVSEIVAAATLTPASTADVAWMTRLYTQQLACYPCTTERTDSEWIWQPRNQSSLEVLVAADRSGYAMIGKPIDNALVVWEACAVAGSESTFLDVLAAEAKRRGNERLYLRLPPTHALSGKLLQGGATLRAEPATSGMAAITNWSAVLPQGFALHGDVLHLNSLPVLKAPHQRLVQLACGYLSVDASAGPFCPEIDGS